MLDGMDDLKTNDHPVHTMPNLSSNHLAAKSLVRHSIPSRKLQVAK